MRALLGFLSQDLAIDLGTSYTRIWVAGRGVVSHEPSLIAVQDDRKGGRKVLAAGHAARAMLGRVPSDIQVIHPLRDGVISDFEATEAMLRFFIGRTVGRGRAIGARTLVCIPHGTTEMEKRAVRECAESAGGRPVLLVEVPLAAALGADLSVLEPHGHMVVDIGGGTTEVAVLSMGGIVYSRTLRVAGDHMDLAIIRHIEERYQLLIGPRSAEDIKLKSASVKGSKGDETFEVKGRDLRTGYPRMIFLAAEEVREALLVPLKQITDAIVGSLERTPPDLVSDIADRGIILTGGGSLLSCLPETIREATGLPVIMTEDPLMTVIIGAGRLLSDLGRFRPLLV